MLFSIIIPIYNSPLLDRAIKSIKSQTFKDYEIIVIDDCSDVPVTQNDIKVIRNSCNLGAGLSRQVGIDNAQGEFLLFLDADDEFHDKHVLERFSKLTEYDLVKTKFLEIGKGYTTIRDTANSGCVYGKLYRKDFIVKNGIKFQNFKLCEDTAFNNDLIQFYPKTLNSEIVSYNHYAQTGGLTSGDWVKNALEWIIKANIHVYEFFKDRNINISYTQTVKGTAFNYYYFEGLRIDNRLTDIEIADYKKLFREWEDKTQTLALLETHQAFNDFFYTNTPLEYQGVLKYLPRFIDDTGLINFYSEILGRKWKPLINKRGIA